MRRGVFKSVPDLDAKLRAYVEGWNKRAHPFRVDQNRRGDPQEGQPFHNFKSAPLGPPATCDEVAPQFEGRPRRCDEHSASRDVAYSFWPCAAITVAVG